MDNNMDNNMESVSFKAFESVQARADRRFRLMWALLILMLIALIGTNAGWIIYESQFEDVTITQDNTDGLNNYIGNDGSINNYGEANN